MHRQQERLCVEHELYDNTIDPNECNVMTSTTLKEMCKSHTCFNHVLMNSHL
jgi:hypothetical protein